MNLVPHRQLAAIPLLPSSIQRSERYNGFTWRAANRGNSVATRRRSSTGLIVTVLRWLQLPLFAIAMVSAAVASEKPTLAAEPITHPHTGPAADIARGRLDVAPGGRYLMYADGTPFFYLSDTNWELAPRARREDVEKLFEKRRSQGFTVVFFPVTGILDGLQFDRPLELKNVYGDLAFHDRDITRPVETDGSDPNDPEAYDYWDHIDFIIDTAAAKGLYVALLCAWDNHYNSGMLNASNGRAYGRFLGKRFGRRENLIWVMGGDTAPTHPLRSGIVPKLLHKANDLWSKATGQEKLEGEFAGTIGTKVFDEVAMGVRETEAFRHLMTYHTTTALSSSQWFHDRDWLDFNMSQSGHNSRDNPNYLLVSADYARRPAKPATDGESRYEGHAVGHDPSKGWFDDFDVRQASYWALFAGAHGLVYGNRGVWQMYEPGREKFRPLRNYWYDAMDLPGAWDMIHVRRLMQSRPFLSRVPDQSLLVHALSGADHLAASRGDGYAFVYTPTGQAIEIVPAALNAKSLNAWWFDPRTGATERIGSFDGHAATLRFAPPGEPGRGNDWVLVLDDAAQNFSPPGS